MPLCDLLLQHLVNQLVLLDHSQTLEFGRLDFNRIHRSAAAADVLYLEVGSARHSHNMLYAVAAATVAGIVSVTQQFRYAAAEHPLTGVPSLITDMAIVVSTR